MPHRFRVGWPRDTSWSLRPDLYHRLAVPGPPLQRDRRVNWEAAKTRVLSVLKQRSERGEPGLSHAEIRQITHLDRFQVIRLTRKLMRETNQIILSGKGRYASYEYKSVK